MLRFSALLLVFALVGCNSSTPNATVAKAGHDHDEDEHGHEPAGGPHGGDIVELGEYHGEIVHDDAAGTVTVFILNGEAVENVPVDVKEAMINVTREGLAKQYVLAASPVDGEPAGFSSRFVSSDAELMKALDEEGTAAVFAIAISGTQQRGVIDHHHGEEHDHEGDEGHDHEDKE